MKKTNFPTDKELKKVRNKLNKGVASRPLPKDSGPADRIKYQVCEMFVIYKNKSKITQRALAKEVGVDEALMSKILHYHIDEFTLDRLVKFLEKLYPNIEVKMKVA